jgi:hypothetical protein
VQGCVGGLLLLEALDRACRGRSVGVIAGRYDRISSDNFLGRDSAAGRGADEGPRRWAGRGQRRRGQRRPRVCGSR